MCNVASSLECPIFNRKTDGLQRHTLHWSILYHFVSLQVDGGDTLTFVACSSSAQGYCHWLWQPHWTSAVSTSASLRLKQIRDAAFREAHVEALLDCYVPLVLISYLKIPCTRSAGCRRRRRRLILAVGSSRGDLNVVMVSSLLAARSEYSEF